MEKTRITRQKRLILAVLETSPEPLTAGEIYARAILQQPNMAKSTVYRNLDAMRRRGEVTQGLLENGESFYAPADAHDHKHYMVCTICHAKLDLPECPLGPLQQQAATAAHFTVTGHVVQLYGYCRQCADKQKKKGI